jgi:hypothetical protein
MTTFFGIKVINTIVVLVLQKHWMHITTWVCCYIANEEHDKILDSFEIETKMASLKGNLLVHCHDLTITQMQQDFKTFQIHSYMAPWGHQLHHHNFKKHN